LKAAAESWCRAVVGILARGRLLVIDYDHNAGGIFPPAARAGRCAPIAVTTSATIYSRMSANRI
jgi:hypothetical protein